MLKKFFGDTLTDLGHLEGDYRVFHLKSDISQGILYMIIVSAGNLAMLRVDALLFRERSDLFMLIAAARVGYMLVTAAFGIILSRTTRVRVFDRVLFGWMLFTIICLGLANFTRPPYYLSTAIDILVPFAIYALSPLKLKYTVALAVGFSAGTIYVGHFHKSGVDLILMNDVALVLVVVHLLGWISTLQIQTYRRKSFRAFIDEKDAREMVAYLVNIDPLTKSLTRRQFMNIAESEFRRFTRYRRPFSLLILDADLFKKINDTYGHHAGDLTLRSLSLVVMEQKRAQDTFGRLGGEEFALLMPETTLTQALVVAERIRKTWADSPVNLDGELIHSTISVGVAEALETDQSFEDLLRRADRMLYKAKSFGRNRVAAN